VEKRLPMRLDQRGRDQASLRLDAARSIIRRVGGREAPGKNGQAADDRSGA